MKITFAYNRDKDIWCLLNKGKSSNNSSNPTSVYQALISKVGTNLNEMSVSAFIDGYMKENNIQPETFITMCEKSFNRIATDFQSVAEKVFGVCLDRNITVYLTINNRCPYNLEEGTFFVSMSKDNPLLTMMHELWHFYTWERFGQESVAQLGSKKYNDLKESLTVLLNTECRHLLSEGEDKGYPQHQDLRAKILELWKQKNDIEYVWSKSASLV